ncbi:MAG: hypothetical protein IJB12_06180 [Methanocorpusculum sp.]|nr:hypothetical protein [Methanocorpusculum sp.]MBQ4597971.1 hypothetical protein [Methanocorpusculum sp.]
MSARQIPWSKLLFPPLWLIGILAIACAIALFRIFSRGMESSPAAYAVYTLSFYTLLILSLTVWRNSPRWHSRVREIVYGNTYIRQYVTDAVFKTQINLACSLALDVLYAGVNILLAVFFSTNWFAIFAGYYTVLSCLRILLFQNLFWKRKRENPLRELKRARFCSGILLTVNLVLSALVLMMLYRPHEFGDMGLLIYVAALYTFSALAVSITGLIRFRKYKSPVLSVSRMINLTAALVSLLILETAMLSQFGGDMPLSTQNIFIAATGAGISIVIIVTALYMILRTTRMLRQLSQ